MKLPSSLPNTSVTDELIQEVEELIGFKLPKSYIDLMRQWNGGPWDTHLFDHNKYPDPKNTTFHFGEIRVNGLSGISTDAGELHSIAASPHTIEEWELPDNLLLLHYLGNKWIALDYTTGSEPNVIIVTENNEKIQLATNFEEFIERLELLEHDD